jgi:serine/threonine protein kinase
MELRAYWLLDKEGMVIPDDVRERPDAPQASTLVIAAKLASKNLLERLHECRKEQRGEGGIPLPELLVYIRQSAEAIDHLNAPIHQLGDRLVSIQHRDIKPENILLSANTVKVTDFGLAKVMEGASAVIHGDSAGLTLSYAAPEVFSNKVTAWSDQYSLAVTYFHLRTGTLPFRASAPTQIFIIHVEGKLELNPLPEAERAVIARATAVDPTKRFPSCKDMVRALEDACGLYEGTSRAAMQWSVDVNLPGPESKLAPDTGQRGSPRPTDPAEESPSKPKAPSGPKPSSSPKLPRSTPDAPPGSRPGGSGTVPTVDVPKRQSGPPPSDPHPRAPRKPEDNPYVTITSGPPPAAVAQAAELQSETPPEGVVPEDTSRVPPVFVPKPPSNEVTLIPSISAPWPSLDDTLVEEKEEAKKEGVQPSLTAYLIDAQNAQEPPAWQAAALPPESVTEAEKTRLKGRFSRKLLLWTAMVLLTVGLGTSAAIALSKILTPLPPPTAEETIASLISNGQIDEAWNKLSSAKAELTAKQAEDFDKEIRKLSLEKADAELNGKQFRKANQTITAFLDRFPGDTDGKGRQDAITNKLKQEGQLDAKVKQQLGDDEWEKALTTVQEIKTGFPEETETAEKLADQAVNRGIELCQGEINKITGATTWKQAQTLYQQALKNTQSIKPFNEERATALANEARTKLIQSGNQLGNARIAEIGKASDWNEAKERYKDANTNLIALVKQEDQSTGKALATKASDELVRIGQRQARNKIGEIQKAKDWKNAKGQFDSAKPLIEEIKGYQEEAGKALTAEAQEQLWQRGQVECRGLIKQASEDPKKFEDAFALSRKVASDGPSAKADGLEKEVLEAWIKYGRDRLAQKNSDEAEKVAKRVLEVKTEFPGALKLIADIRLAERLKGISALVDDFAAAMEKKDAKEAHAKLSSLSSKLGELDDDQKTLIRDMLATKSMTVVRLAPQAQDQVAAQSVLADLEKLLGDRVKFDVALAKARLGAASQNYEESCKQICQAKNLQAEGRNADLVQALADLATQASRDKKITPADSASILDLCKENLPEKPVTPAEIVLVQSYCKLADRLVAQRLADSGNSEAYKRLLNLCQTALETGKAEPETIAYVVEHQVVQDNGELISSANLSDKARDSIIQAGKVAKDDRFVHYVLGLVDMVDVVYPEAVSQFDAAGLTSPERLPWQNERRLRLTGKAYAVAGDQVEMQAEKAFTLYDAALKLDPSLAKQQYDRKLAGAAFRSEHWKVCETVTTKLLPADPSKLPDDAYQLAVWNAKSREHLPEQRRGALDRYNEIIRWRMAKAKRADEIDAVPFEHDIVEPALTIGEELRKGNPRLDAPVARDYGIKGDLILDDPYNKEWNFSNGAWREAALAFREALKCFPDKSAPEVAHYHAQLGWAMAGIAPLDLPAIQQEAKAALEIDKRELKGWSLQAYCAYLDAFRYPRLSEDLIKNLEESNRLYEAAIKQARGGSDAEKQFKSECHAYRSINFVHLANNRSLQLRKQIKADLENGENDARAAKDLTPKSDLAWGSLANIEEDLAWSYLGKEPSYYEKAEKAFKMWKELHPANLNASVGLARMYIRWAEDVPALKAKEDAAKTILQEVLQTDPQQVEANYWLGYYQWKHGDQNKGTQCFANALKHPTEGWNWLVGIDNVIRGRKPAGTLEDWTPVFNLVLKDTETYGPGYAPALYKRAELVFYGPEDARSADLKTEKPQLIRDAEAAAKSAKNTNFKRNAYYLAALSHAFAVRFAVERGDKDGALDHREKVLANYRSLLKADPAAWPRAQELAEFLEAYARQKTDYSVDQRNTYKNQAITWIKQAWSKAPEAERPRLKKILERIEAMSVSDE